MFSTEVQKGSPRLEHIVQSQTTDLRMFFFNNENDKKTHFFCTYHNM